MKKALTNTLYWATWLLIYALAIVLIGSVAGGLIFLSIGWALPHMPTWDARIVKGVYIGARLSGIWAVGLGTVLCFIQAHRKRYPS